MAQGHGQGIGNIIWFRYLPQVKNGLDHGGHLLFGGPTITHHGLLNLEGSIFTNLALGLSSRQQAYAPGLAHEKGIGNIAVEKKLLHSDGVRLPALKQFAGLLINAEEPLFNGLSSRRADTTIILRQK